MRNEASIGNDVISMSRASEINDLVNVWSSLNESTNQRKMESVGSESTVTFQIYEDWVEQERDHFCDSDRLNYDIIALQGESGEIASEMKKLLREVYSTEEFEEKILLECGDTLHYLVRILHDIGYSLPDAMTANMEKIENRKKYGKGNHGTRS